MSNLPISSKYRSTPTQPVDDAEREDLTARLNDSFGKGDLPAEQYQAMLDQIYAAQTLGELVPVVEHLPVKQTYNSPAIVAQSGPAPGELTQHVSANRAGLVAAGVITGAILLIGLVLLMILL